MDTDDEQKAKGILPESVRKALAMGLSAVFMTEEGIRNALGDMRLPKEAMSFLTQQAERTRKDLFRMVSDELKGFLKDLDLSTIIKKALDGMTFEVQAKIKLTRDEKDKLKIDLETSPKSTKKTDKIITE